MEKPATQDLQHSTPNWTKYLIHIYNIVQCDNKSTFFAPFVQENE